MTDQEAEHYERLEAGRWTCSCGHSSLSDPCSACGRARLARLGKGSEGAMSHTGRSESASRPAWLFMGSRGPGSVCGVVYTPDGIVTAETEKYIRGGSTRLEFCHQGRRYRRFFDRQYQPRYIVTLAARFAREIAEAAP